jgi:hypothetical protein
MRVCFGGTVPHALGQRSRLIQQTPSAAPKGPPDVLELSREGDHAAETGDWDEAYHAL